MFDRNIIKNLDFMLIFIVLIIFAVGIVFIGSTSYDTGFNITRDIKIQSIAFGLGLIAIVVILFIDYSLYESMDKFLYIFSILFLLAVYVPGLGKEQFGARSWIDLGPVDFQPAELVKITFILIFAKYLKNHRHEISTLKGLVKAIGYVSPLILLILIQPDLGTALVLVFISIGMLVGAGIDYKFFGKVGFVGILSVPILYNFMASHQKIRIDAFLNPNDLSLPGNYQVWNSKVAIGSGNLLGKGLFLGTQKKLKFLPVQESDFIFAVISEEIGFLGGTSIILLYLAFLYKIIRISRKAKDSYGFLIVIGILSMFCFQIFENIGMTMGIMPVTGITLPFISYGGSSVLINMIAVGIVLNVGMRHRKINF